jgi:hypothetical protein
MRSAGATQLVATASKPPRRRRQGRIDTRTSNTAPPLSTATSTGAEPNPHLSPGTDRLVGAELAAAGGDQSPTGTQCRHVSAGVAGIPVSVDPIVLAGIVDRHRVRRSLLIAEKAMGQRIKGKERSAATYRLRAQGKELPPGKLPIPTAEDKVVVAQVYPSFFLARAAIEAQRLAEEKALVADVGLLPIMSDWAAHVRGLGPLSIAALVGETGDPGAYATPSRMWKRLGLAVVDGRAQRRVAGDTEEAIRQGYSPARRAGVFIIGENLIRSSNVHARAIYDAVKAKEVAKDGIALGHAHKRALRVMQKRLVLAFWLAWRQLERGEPLSEVPKGFMTISGGTST